jgi:putative membrane protein
MDGMAEVEPGRLAGQNATPDEVKPFARRMVDDHGKQMDGAQRTGVREERDLPTARREAHGVQEKLSRMKGAAFEDTAWAAKTLPTLREHLRWRAAPNDKLTGAE